MKTFAFKNSQKYWSTRYSFAPTNYSTIDRDMFTSPGGTSLWRHGPKATNGKNNFYGSQYSSTMKFSFNEAVSANKIYKNISLEGSLKDKDITATFRANDSSDKTQQRPSNISHFVEKASHLHANIGKTDGISRATMKPVGRVKKMHQIFVSNPTDLNSGFDRPESFTGEIWGWGLTNGIYTNGSGVSLKDVYYDAEKRQALIDAGQGWMIDLFGSTITSWGPNGVDLGPIAFSDMSPYLFLEVDFVGGYTSSSEQTKYVLGSSSEYLVGMEGASPTDFTFQNIPSAFFSFGSGIDSSPNVASIDITPLTWNDEAGRFDKIEYMFPETTPPAIKTKKDIRSGLFLTYNPSLLKTCTETVTLEDGTVINPCLPAADSGPNVENPDLVEFLTTFDNKDPEAVYTYLNMVLNFGAATGTASNDIASAVTAFNEAATKATFYVYAITPGSVDGEAARGNYADFSINIKGDFELDAVNLEYEPTQLDHSR